MHTHSRSNFAFDMSQTDDFFIVPFVDSIFSYCFATSTLSTVQKNDDCKALNKDRKWHFCFTLATHQTLWYTVLYCAYSHLLFPPMMMHWYTTACSEYIECIEWIFHRWNDLYYSVSKSGYWSNDVLAGFASNSLNSTVENQSIDMRMPEYTAKNIQ